MDDKDRLITEILQLGYLVQTKTKYCVFINFSGHVDKFEVRICESKERWQNEILSTEFSSEYRRYSDEKDRLAFYKAKRDILLSILQEQEIPYELCDVEQYLVEEWTF